jgi:hypothetical protein
MRSIDAQIDKSHPGAQYVNIFRKAIHFNGRGWPSK